MEIIGGSRIIRLIFNRRGSNILRIDRDLMSMELK